ncbi:MAG: hypothetical protein ACOX17_03210 [Christensenellales bacterium]|jgi:hypothetical protein
MDWDRLLVIGEVEAIRMRKLRGERFRMENRSCHGLAFVTSDRYRYARGEKSWISESLDHLTSPGAIPMHRNA